MTPLIIENGKMPDGANTYAGLDEADAYLSGRGLAAWAEADIASRSAALLRAADVLNSYAWRGNTAAPGRVMAWPRSGMAYAGGEAVPADRVPVRVVQAQCELAGAMIGGDTPLAAVDKSRGPVTVERVDAVSVSYADPRSCVYAGATGYPAVDALLRPFLRPGLGGGFCLKETGRG